MGAGFPLSGQEEAEECPRADGDSRKGTAKDVEPIPAQQHQQGAAATAGAWGGSGWARELLAPGGVMALDKALWGWGLCSWGFAVLSCTEACSLLCCGCPGCCRIPAFPALWFRHHLAHRSPYFCLELCLCCSAFW